MVAVEELRCLLRAEVVAQEARCSPVAEAAVQVRHIALRVVVVELEVAVAVAAEVVGRCMVEPEPERAVVVAGPEVPGDPACNPQQGDTFLPKALNISMQRWIPF